MKHPSSLEALKSHPFVALALREGFLIQKTLGPKHPARLEPDYSRDPDEHEFYLLRVGKCLADLLTCCDHLDHIPSYLANYRETAAMKKVGLNRHEYIVLHVEGYLIRVGGLQDRCLKLIDAVFHLLNDDRNATEHIVLKNIKVKRTKVTGAMKTIAKLVQTYAAKRNDIVHHASYTDDSLRILEMYHLVQRSDELDGGKKKTNYSEHIKEMTAEVVRDKRKEFVTFNATLAAALPALLESLQRVYDVERQKLKAYVSA